MENILAMCLILLVSAAAAHADYRGCCSEHGGIVCENGITRCIDGTELSESCQAKDCNICEESVFSPAASDNIKVASFNIQVFGRSKASKPEVMGVWPISFPA
nr:hypothetical protein [uncultured Desulfobacter sp.]